MTTLPRTDHAALARTCTEITSRPAARGGVTGFLLTGIPAVLIVAASTALIMVMRGSHLLMWVGELR